jgi:hypothetical protein
MAFRLPFLWATNITDGRFFMRSLKATTPLLVSDRTATVAPDLMTRNTCYRVQGV